ncbi:MAG: hypothetical protein IRZ13_01010 [Acetobacteraceae bacterium]|nr:hypothetical protein [Acetobacteraceae bacterium]
MASRTKQSPGQRETVRRVMHEYKHGTLRTGHGERKVRNPKQAVAIAMHEAGVSREESPARNRRSLARTKAREHAGATGGRRHRGEGRTRAELYAEARWRGIPGRSHMTKAELERALRRAH